MTKARHIVIILILVNALCFTEENFQTPEKLVNDTLSPNRLGLYDMSGNMWEFVYDYLSPTTHTLRGGSFGATEAACKLSYMHFSSVAQELALSFFSFRIASSIIN